MAQNLSPSHWLPSYSADSSAITIPLASLPGLSAAEAHATTGDIRKVARALMAALYGAWMGEETDDRPSRMRLSRSTSVDDLSDTTTRTYVSEFEVETEGEDVADEPAAQEG